MQEKADSMTMAWVVRYRGPRRKGDALQLLHVVNSCKTIDETLG